MLELFAGSGRFGREAARSGHLVVLIDIRFGEKHDVRRRELQRTILEWIRIGWVTYAALALPCCSWSRARNRGGGPQRLRTAEHIMGLPTLDHESERWKIDLGNVCMRFGVACARALHARSAGFFIENPWTSWMWVAPPMVRLAALRGCRLVRSDFCQFGTPWRKSTGVLTNGPPHFVNLVCRGPKPGVCSRTLCRHVHLEGTDGAGRFLTSLAEPYPRPFCKALVAMLNFYEKHCEGEAFYAGGLTSVRR